MKKMKRCRICGVVLDENNCPPSWRKNANYICRDCARETRDLERDKIYSKKWRKSNPDYFNHRYNELKRKVFDHYGRKCECCGETHKEFLSIDHINGGGTKHRKEILKGGNLYSWLVANNFPEGFRVLCHNCNFAIGHYGYCPHQSNQERQWYERYQPQNPLCFSLGSMSDPLMFHP